MRSAEGFGAKIDGPNEGGDPVQQTIWADGLPKCAQRFLNLTSERPNLGARNGGVASHNNWELHQIDSANQTR